MSFTLAALPPSDREVAWRLNANAVCLARCAIAWQDDVPCTFDPMDCTDYPGVPYHEPAGPDLYATTYTPPRYRWLDPPRTPLWQAIGQWVVSRWQAWAIALVLLASTVR